jgi:hypothetical protein
MIPRAVQMAKAVSDIIGPSNVEEYGNIISKPYKGWSNIYGSYFLGSPGSSPSDTLGNPAMFSYSVHSWASGNNPKWAQPPLRMFNIGFGNVLCPTYDRLTPPQFNEVSP